MTKTTVKLQDKNKIRKITRELSSVADDLELKRTYVIGLLRKVDSLKAEVKKLSELKKTLKYETRARYKEIYIVNSFFIDDGFRNEYEEIIRIINTMNKKGIHISTYSQGFQTKRLANEFYNSVKSKRSGSYNYLETSEIQTVKVKLSPTRKSKRHVNKKKN